MNLSKTRASRSWMLCLIFLISTASALAANVRANQPGDSSAAAFGGCPVGTLQAAIDSASPGDTITINSNITEGQINVSVNNLTLTTSNGSTISLGCDTGDAGDNRAWFLVPSGINLTVTNLTFNGNGFDCYQAFRHKGTGSFTNVTFNDIEFAGPNDVVGSAIVSFSDVTSRGGVGVSVNSCTFTQIGLHALFAFNSSCSIDDSTIIGSGSTGDRITYGIEAGAGASVTATNNSITECRSATAGGFQSAAVVSSTFFGGGTSVSLTGNDIRDNTFGVLTSPSGDTSNIDGAFNSFVGNASGVNIDPSADFQNNWWGCDGGPGSAGCDSAISISGFLDVDPWLVFTLDPPPVGTTPATCLITGQSATMTANLNVNSDGSNVGGSGDNHVPDGTSVSWDAGGEGSFNPVNTTTTNGASSSVYTAGPFTGLFDFCATVDNALNCQPIYLGVTKIPTLTEYGMIAFITLLATAALVMMRRQRAAA